MMWNWPRVAAASWLAIAAFVILAAVLSGRPAALFCEAPPTMAAWITGEPGRCGFWAWLHDWQEGLGAIVGVFGAVTVARLSFSWAEARQRAEAARTVVSQTEAAFDAVCHIYQMVHVLRGFNVVGSRNYLNLPVFWLYRRSLPDGVTTMRATALPPLSPHSVTAPWQSILRAAEVIAAEIAKFPEDQDEPTQRQAGIAFMNTYRDEMGAILSQGNFVLVQLRDQARRHGGTRTMDFPDWVAMG